MLEKIKRVIKYILYGIPTEHILKCNVVVSQSTKKLLGKKHPNYRRWTRPWLLHCSKMHLRRCKCGYSWKK